jgi:hypothetical protein
LLPSGHELLRIPIPRTPMNNALPPLTDQLILVYTPIKQS